MEGLRIQRSPGSSLWLWKSVVEQADRRSSFPSQLAYKRPTLCVPDNGTFRWTRRWCSFLVSPFQIGTTHPRTHEFRFAGSALAPLSECAAFGCFGTEFH